MVDELNTSGTGTVDHEPDMANLEVSVNIQDESRSSAVGEMTRLADEVSTALEEENVVTNVTTENYVVDKVNNNRNPHHDNEEPTEMYRAIHSYGVYVSDVDAVGDVIDVALDAGATDIGRIHFELSDETYNECRDKAIERAVNEARHKAEVAAEASNVQVAQGVRELTVERDNMAGVGRNAGIQLSSTIDTMSTSIENDSVSVSVTVSVVYGVN